ncbi:MAG: ERCC4 domain-containing protein [Candidatus Nanoarchaeia archaeon]
MITVIVDTREDKSLDLIKILESKNYVEVLYETLESGDYIVNNFVIERKTTDDFVSSLYDNRLKKQMKVLSCQKAPVLLIEGSWKQPMRYRDVSFTQINEALNVIQFKYNIKVIWAESQKESAYRIISLGFFDPNDVIEVHRKAMNNDWSVKEKQLYLLKGIRGIGEKTANEIINKYNGSLIDFFSKVVKNPRTRLEKKIRQVLIGK